MKPRRAFTLVEMSAALSVGSVLMVLAMGTVHRAMRVESTMRERASTQRTSTRLARQFRHDVHRAQAVSLDIEQAGAAVLQLELPGGSPIVYRVISGSVLREQTKADSPSHREQFKFPDNFVVEFKTLPTPQRVALTVKHETGLVDVSPRIELHLEAVVGQLLRLSQPQEPSP